MRCEARGKLDLVLSVRVEQQRGPLTVTGKDDGKG